jgi:DNA-binding LytR/AlgR family response regulator
MNCLIIEDEVPAQEILISYIEKVPELTLVDVCNSALNADLILKTGKIDILFLDINLPIISGMAYLKTLRRPPIVIMTTAYSNFAVESFEYDSILDYLVKPFSFERFLKAINKIDARQHQSTPRIQYEAVNEVVKNEDHIFVKVDKSIHRIEIDNIILIQSDRNYVTIVSQGLSLSFIDSLKNWLIHLNRNNFIQVHKSFILNLNYIQKLTGNLVYANKQKIPVGKTFKAELIKRLNPIN